MANPVIELEDLVDLFPEFANVDEDRVEALNPIADLYVSTNAFGDATGYAKTLVIAHLIKMGDNPNGGGLVTSTRVGDLARTYSTPTGVDGTWVLSSYGIQFEALKKARVMGLGHVSPSGSSFIVS